MKSPTRKVTVLLLILVVEIQCGVIDNIYGRVKNTTSGLGKDVKNVWSFSKNLVGLESATKDNRPEEEKRGLIGGMLHSTREKIHNVRIYFWNTNSYEKDAGIFGNMYNRVKNRLSKIKGSIVGDNPSPPQPLSENEKLIKNTLDKLFFGNGTRQVNGRAFQEVIDNLRKKVHDIRNNITGTNPVNHGEGLIDVRLAPAGVREAINENSPGIDNDVYDAVDDGLSKLRNETASTYEVIRDKAANEFRNGIDNTVNQLNAVKDKVSDAVAKENELLRNRYNNVNSDAKKIENNVKDAAEDVKRLSY